MHPECVYDALEMIDWITFSILTLFESESEESAVVEWLASGISKPGVRSPVAALRSWWSALGQGTYVLA